MEKLKYTVKTHINEEHNNSLTTILEELDIREEEYLRDLISKDIQKRERRYVENCR